jgi:hypothetical protein
MWNVSDNEKEFINLGNRAHSESTAAETVKNLICGPDVTNRWLPNVAF